MKFLLNKNSKPLPPPKRVVIKGKLPKRSGSVYLMDIAKGINQLVVSYYGEIKHGQLIRIKVRAEGNVTIDLKKDKDYTVDRHTFNTKARR